MLGGWLEQGITFSNYPDAHFNGPVFTNDWNGEYQMNQFWMFLDRPAKNDGEGWAWGAHLDMIYGTDWRFGICHGLEDRINDFNRQSYGLVIPQLYVDLAYNDLTVKMGHYAGILGYEVVAAPANPFYSHSYAMAFSEPILVTGALADYKLSEQWSILGGIDRGWMTFEDVNNIWDFMGGVRWTSRNKKTSVAYSVDVGPQDPDGLQQRFVSSLVFKHQVDRPLPIRVAARLWPAEERACASARVPNGTASTSIFFTSSTTIGRPTCGPSGFATTTACAWPARRPTRDCACGR